MDDKRLAFETAMTQAAIVAKENMDAAEYQRFMAQIERAWASYDNAIDRAIDEAMREVKSQPTDKRWSLSVTLGLHKEG